MKASRHVHGDFALGNGATGYVDWTEPELQIWRLYEGGLKGGKGTDGTKKEAETEN